MTSYVAGYPAGQAWRLLRTADCSQQLSPVLQLLHLSERKRHCVVFMRQVCCTLPEQSTRSHVFLLFCDRVRKQLIGGQWMEWHAWSSQIQIGSLDRRLRDILERMFTALARRDSEFCSRNSQSGCFENRTRFRKVERCSIRQYFCWQTTQSVSSYLMTSYSQNQLVLTLQQMLETCRNQNRVWLLMVK